MNAHEVITYWVLVFVSILGVLNPVRVSGIMAVSTKQWEPRMRAKAANRAVLTAGLILLVASWIGNHIIFRSYIHVGGFRVASGLLLITWVIRELVADSPLKLWSERHGVEWNGEHAGLYPLGTKLLAGPAAMATVVLYSGEVHELWRRLVTVAALALVLLIAWVMLRWSHKFYELLGEVGTRYTSHALRLTVLAWAVDFTAVGIRDLLPLILHTPPAGS